MIMTPFFEYRYLALLSPLSVSNSFTMAEGPDEGGQSKEVQGPSTTAEKLLVKITQDVYLFIIIIIIVCCLQCLISHSKHAYIIHTY